MEQFLNMLPILYVYWACGLIVWSTMICTMQCMVLVHNKKRHQSCRRSDILMLFAVGTCGIFMGISVFVIPQMTFLFVEIALLMALWYTVFLVAINHMNIISFVSRN